MKRISMATARRLFNKGIEIYMLPSKVAVENIWILPANLHKGDSSFDVQVNAYRYYNCSAETGNRIHFYIEGG